ncbi:hypothetical protein QBC33DRAFT_564067 [Phialemonium atrogriseum]|uniref:Uncharacterized protein n=1 Tax=Phialemonium atrogriseum TaxID=1093897 RepID=A0AAJ0BPL9_9PEZI|nr:uncharacterized protein QBC33DRAFT_564067 [Phialemonium atrogriseum]KAK1762143.1 hypothetical protein QBC33DRAFT_564067 [Phialemonium atrogriseum]
MPTLDSRRRSKSFDTQWQIIFQKLEAFYGTGAEVVLSKLPIGNLATQYFAVSDVGQRSLASRVLKRPIAVADRQAVKDIR